jgi:predicted RNA-binding protein YlxR (DUF448 family)
MKRGHVPMRMCVFCRRREPKHLLERHGGRFGSAEDQAAGRGWYVCRDPACLKKLAALRVRALSAGDRPRGTKGGGSVPAPDGGRLDF